MTLRTLTDIIHGRSQHEQSAIGLYLVPGFPTWPASMQAVGSAVRSGVDFIEFPVVHEAEWSQRTGSRIAEALRIMLRTPPEDRRFAEWLVRVPVRVAVVYPSARWDASAAVTGSAGILFEGPVRDPDVRAAAELGLPIIGTTDITTPVLETQEEAGLRSAGGFVYAAMGRRTGAEAEPPAMGKLDKIRSVRPDLPICCAFGIRDHNQVTELRQATGCDGVIVGTAALDVLERGLDEFDAWLAEMVAAAHANS